METNYYDVSDKFRLIRTRERLTQKEFAEMINIPYSSYQNYERGVRRAISIADIIDIFKNPKLKKYLVWFMTNSTELDIKQVSPE